MDCRCSSALPVMTGWGPPDQPYDPEEYAPVYVDLKSGRSWIALPGGGWAPSHVPLAWLQEELSPLLPNDAWITINRGGSPGDYDGQENYFVSRVSDLVKAIARRLRLNDLSDVDAPRPGDNDALVFDGTNWVAGMIPYALDDLTDVSVSSAAGGQVLSRDGDNWVAAPVRRLLDMLGDVDAAAPRDRDILLYEPQFMRWVPGRLAMKLNDLEDVEALPARGDYLTFDGTMWRATFGRQAVSARCAGCASPMSVSGGDYWFDVDNRRLFRVAPDGDMDETLVPDLVVCMDNGRVFARNGAVWVEIDLVTPQGHNIIVSTVEAADLDAAIAAGLQPGMPWLQSSEGTPSLRYYAAEGCDIASGLKPKLIITRNTCRMYTGMNDSTGQFTIAPVGPHASQVCVDPCEGSPWTERTSLQEALCQIVSTALPNVNACVADEGFTPHITSTMRLDQALCTLDQALQQVREQLSSASVNVGPCADGPINATMTAAQAICQLSTIIGGAPTTLPIAGTGVNVQACASGVVNAAMNVQQAICALSSAVAQPPSGTVAASTITMTPCPNGALSSATTIQDAVCALSGGTSGFASYLLTRHINLDIVDTGVSAGAIVQPASLPSSWTPIALGLQGYTQEYPGGSTPLIYTVSETASGVDYMELPAGDYLVAATLTVDVAPSSSPAQQGVWLGAWDVNALSSASAMDNPLLVHKAHYLGPAQTAWTKVMDVQISGVISLASTTQVCFLAMVSPYVSITNDTDHRLDILVFNLAKRT